jgi:hypothetical protein
MLLLAGCETQAQSTALHSFLTSSGYGLFSRSPLGGNSVVGTYAARGSNLAVWHDGPIIIDVRLCPLEEVDLGSFPTSCPFSMVVLSTSLWATTDSLGRITGVLVAELK